MRYRRISNLRIPRPPERSQACADVPVSRPKPVRKSPKLRAEVLIPGDSPIIQAEIEVIAALLDDWDSLLAESDRE